jgi:hypothetical protein
MKLARNVMGGWAEPRTFPRSSTLLGSVSVIVVQDSTEALPALDLTSCATYLFSRFDQAILQSLMIPLSVIMQKDSSDAAPDGVLAEENHSFEGLRFQTSMKSLQMRIQVWTLRVGLVEEYGPKGFKQVSISGRELREKLRSGHPSRSSDHAAGDGRYLDRTDTGKLSNATSNLFAHQRISNDDCCSIFGKGGALLRRSFGLRVRTNIWDRRRLYVIREKFCSRGSE